MMEIVERNDVSPVCPHCKTSISTVWCQGITTLLGKRYVYFCPDCRSVLGVTHRKGLLTG